MEKASQLTDTERLDAALLSLAKALENVRTLSLGVTKLTEHVIAQEKRLNDLELRATTLAVDMPPTSRLLPKPEEMQ